VGIQSSVSPTEKLSASMLNKIIYSRQKLLRVQIFISSLTSHICQWLEPLTHITTVFSVYMGPKHWGNVLSSQAFFFLLCRLISEVAQSIVTNCCLVFDGDPDL